MSADRRRFALSPSARRAVLTLHIVVSVGLLGDSAGYLAVAIRGATADDPAFAAAADQMLQMFAFVFGIPLSLAALLTGITLGIGTRWGVFRYPWVTAKLLLIISVMLVGTFVLRGRMDALSTIGGAEVRHIAGAAYDVLALGLATGLAVYKPGRARRRWRRRQDGRPVPTPVTTESSPIGARPTAGPPS